MDASRFDTLTKSFVTPGTRRALLRFLAALPLSAGLAVLLDAESEAAGRRQRRKAKHRHQTGDDKEHRKGKRTGKGRKKGKKKKKGKATQTSPQSPACQPESRAQTCAGKCGQATNNCGTSVDCGPCACASTCPICQICDANTGQCIPDPDAVGDACGTCRTCDAAGTCSIVADGTPCDDGDACTTNDVCTSGVCRGTAVICPATECQVAGTCTAAAGCPDPTNKAANTPCSGGLCCDGVCQDVACCTAAACAAGQDCQEGSCCTMAGQTATSAAPCCAGLSTCADGTCCDGCCGSDGTCGACLVFTTSTLHSGNLGGLSGADAICQQRAQAGNLPRATIAGTYKAWLSDSTGSPATRFRRSALGYTRVDGITVAASWADLTDGTLAAPIGVTELRTPVVYYPQFSWTHTRPDGTAGGPLNDHCQNWSTSEVSDAADVGASYLTVGAWTTGFFGYCNFELRLYCFQQS